MLRSRKSITRESIGDDGRDRDVEGVAGARGVGAIERHAAKLVEGLSAAAHGEAEIALTVAAAEHALRQAVL